MDGKVTATRSLNELLPRVDCLTLHASMTADSKKMIGPDELKRMKPGAVLINCARGGLVDEAAVAAALHEHHLAGAALDVYAEEPPTGSPLLSAPNVTLTPHLGASTAEAQTAVSTDAVDSMLAFLCHGTIQNAVNVAGLPPQLTGRDRAWMDLTMRMGAILAAHGAAGIDRVEVTTQGRDALNALCPTLALQAVVELMSPHMEGRLNLVNAADFARDRGIDIRHSVGTAKTDFEEMVTLTIARGGERHSIEGAVFQDGLPRILAIDGYRMEMQPDSLLVLIFNDDRPGVIGLVGTIFGQHEINIADMFLSRRDGTALMVLKIDGAVGGDVMDELRRQSPPILSIRTVSLPFPPKRGAL
jgi:D-3-phosphoglycerate dehydrogenase